MKAKAVALVLRQASPALALARPVRKVVRLETMPSRLSRQAWRNRNRLVNDGKANQSDYSGDCAL